MSNPADQPPADDAPATPVLPSESQDAAAPEPARRPAGADRRLVVLLTVIAVVVALVDQLSKAWAQTNLADGHVDEILGHALRLQLVYNPGAALSIGTGMTWLLTLVVVVVVVLIVRAARRIRSTGWAIALGLLLGGAIGNLIDRLLRDPGFARGRVVDFIGYGNFFVGNVADIAIVVAAVLIALLALRGVGMDGGRPGASTKG
ncbi:signal peptidase II [Luteimicrobium subarcticum]|uniref:Lipoprotein signal peptidase n=1 Tax=Luteimicrobium subarcticum TaxID=620910 RepID=A0A2M8WTV8_9MICO|nr:signal peptidase II [Luteimicrobium subarcticum]PJI94328.1 signal peptidase II [Luteimicrobium subarcticum]